jgi:ATP-dependent protease ClpP protease subunit
MTEETRPTAAADEENNGSLPEIHRMVDMGSAVTRTAHGNIHCLTIVGQVEGHLLAAQGTKTTKYEHVMPLLAALEENDDIAGILFLLNTMGGDVEAGLGIAELIAGMSKPTVSLVLGGSHSIGIPLAVAARTSFAVPSAAMTVHPVRMTGTVIAAPQTYNYFDRLQERIVEFVTANSHISRRDFLSLMLKTGEMSSDVGSVLYGREAVAKGLIDRVGGLSDALAELYRLIDEAKEDHQP